MKKVYAKCTDFFIFIKNFKKIICNTNKVLNLHKLKKYIFDKIEIRQKNVRVHCVHGIIRRESF